MSPAMERVVLALSAGLLLTGGCALLAFVVGNAGALTLARILLWPNELSAAVFELASPGAVDSSPYAHHSRDIAYMFVGFPLGFVVYSMAAYFALSKSRQEVT